MCSWKNSPTSVSVAACLLTIGCGTIPVSPTPTLDLLAYVVGTPSSWPRIGTQLQQQLVDPARREVAWVKYGRPEMFETWRWDEAFIYHSVDHAVDGETGESYSFTDGRFLPRFLPANGTWSLDVPDNQIRAFGRDCRPLAVRPFPYRVTVNLYGDDLRLLYTPYDETGRSGGGTETFSFRKGLGWYRWESQRGVARFDQIGGPAVSWHVPACQEAS